MSHSIRFHVPPATELQYTKSRHLPTKVFASNTTSYLYSLLLGSMATWMNARCSTSNSSNRSTGNVFHIRITGLQT
ncbi:hypothetical protein GOP47_0021011 [Adiantum capillus-veneris]|uniref:Uncharacterized protein n=1 Tax=Adiantum capillus-veneris TaxID=13818 RepID=A0A9D4UAA2_ADICA|nr:hypothetical protein GOP47_0021011 [Adiantum capillus-veneris]